MWNYWRKFKLPCDFSHLYIDYTQSSATDRYNSIDSQFDKVLLLNGALQSSYGAQQWIDLLQDEALNDYRIHSHSFVYIHSF